MTSTVSGADIEGRILESLGWGVFVVGRDSHRISCWNRRMQEITGVGADQAVGRDIHSVFDYLEGVDVAGAVAEIQRRGCFEARSMRLVRRDGEVVYRQVRGDVLPGRDGEEDGVVVSVLDVTDREQMRLFMGRYLAREVAEMLLATRPEELLPGREVEVAVLVADMRDFTAAAEGLTPEELFETLNTYLAPMVEVVARHQGVIDKFTGDGFMAVFGLVDGDGREAERAMSAALELEQEVQRLGRERAGRGLHHLEMGYGIHWGPASAGSLGSLARMEYTVVGDTVNVAHRVQGLAERGEVLITRAAAQAAGKRFLLEEGRWVRVKGRRAPLKVMRLLGFATEDERSIA